MVYQKSLSFESHRGGRALARAVACAWRARWRVPGARARHKKGARSFTCLFTVKVHLGRVGLERGASEVDSDCKKTYVSEPPRDPPGVLLVPERRPQQGIHTSDAQNSNSGTILRTRASTSTGNQHLGCSELQFWDDSTNRSVDLNRDSTPRSLRPPILGRVYNPERRPQQGFNTSDAQNSNSETMLPTGASTSTGIRHLDR